MKEHAIRLTKGMDLKESIQKYCIENNIEAGAVLSGVGCLYEANIRDASGINSVKLVKPLEIVSLTGTISKNGCHIHISVSDENLDTFGGHLKEGCLINTTCEIVMLELENYIFTRQMDENTGYKELNIQNK